MTNIQEGLNDIIAKWGPWTAHNVEIAPGVFTRPESAGAPNSRIRQILQLATDIVGKTDLSGIRVMDIGCLEGGFAIELALHGAGESNASRARFAAAALRLEQVCTFEQDDARNLSVERYGKFDIVLSLGLLYHLDTESVFRQLESLYECTRRALILDTNVSLIDNFSYDYKGNTYRGHVETEPTAGPWFTYGNLQSYFPTRASLYDALVAAGFSSILECHMPQSAIPNASRVQLVAFKGEPVDIRTVPRPAESLPRYSAHSYLRSNETMHGLALATSQLGTAAFKVVKVLARAAAHRKLGRP